MSNIITALFPAGCRSTMTDPVTQWDYGQILQLSGVDLPDTYTVYYANPRVQNTAVPQIGGADGVLVPDVMLTAPGAITAWLFLHTGPDDGETECTITIPVDPATARTDTPPDPEEQSAIDQAIAALNAGVDRAETAADSAEQSAEAADASATLAESWAVGGTGTRTGEDTDNARHYAEVARQGAEASGYAWFDIDDQTGLMMVTITDNLAEDVTFAINENTGELEVTVNG